MTETTALYSDGDLAELVRQLAEARRAQALSKQRLAELEKALKESQDYKLYSGFLSDANHQATELYHDIRTIAVEIFGQNGDKKPHPAVDIKEMTSMDYDEKLAVAWCKHNFPAAIKLDRSLFEKHARAIRETAPIKFVTFTTVPKANIASNLESFIAEAVE